MQESFLFSRSAISMMLTSLLLLIALALNLNTALAHNKVVVIPMAGDDIEAELEPFALIPPDDTNSANYTSDNGVTLDKVTGLEWQQVDDNNDRTYNSAKNYCFGLNLDGKDDWRLPTLKELFSITDLGTFSPAIDGTAFPGTDDLGYWSQTELLQLNTFRLSVNFSTGFVTVSDDIIDTGRARCVRNNGTTALTQVLRDNADGSVSDLASGLTWMQQASASEVNYAAAVSYCSTLNVAGSNNWRLPQIKELRSIIDYRNFNPSVDQQLFPVISNRTYWSISNSVFSPNSAWIFSFDIFNLTLRSKALDAFALCVR